MTVIRGILGQASPAATTDELLLEVAEGDYRVVTTVFVANRGTATTIRLWIDRYDVITYLYYGTALPANDTLALSAGLTLGPNEKLYCYSTSGDVDFTATGSGDAL